MISLEIIEGCNFKCWFCAAKDLNDYKFMDLDVFKKAVLEAKALGIKTVDMIPSRGDPFLHPKIYEMLDFINQHMEEVLIFTNATPVNVDRLKKVNLSHTILSVSIYGRTPEKFAELTVTDAQMYDKCVSKLKQMKEAGIKFNEERRDVGYEFVVPGEPVKVDFRPEQKCKFHHIPKVLLDGGVTFCRTAWTTNGLSIGNIKDRSLEDILTDPIRYKFMDSQSICRDHCDSYNIQCNTKQTFAAMKLMLKSKYRYNQNTESTDRRYKEIEHEVIQRT